MFAISPPSPVKGQKLGPVAGVGVGDVGATPHRFQTKGRRASRKRQQMRFDAYVDTPRCGFFFSLRSIVELVMAGQWLNFREIGIF